MLTVTDLNAYYGEFHVLEDVSLEVSKGDVVVMLGPNGHGKSTLLKAVCGLVERLTGSITYQGEEISGLPAEKLVTKGKGETQPHYDSTGWTSPPKATEFTSCWTATGIANESRPMNTA